MPDCESVCTSCETLLHDVGEYGLACRTGNCLDNVQESNDGLFYHEDCFPEEEGPFVSIPASIDACYLYGLRMG